MGWRAVAITINTVRASSWLYHDGYSRDGHRSQCLSVYSIEIIKYHREIEKERFAARSSIYLFLDSIRYSFSIGPSDFSRRPARWIGPLTEQQTQKLMVRNLGYCLMMLCIGEEEEEETLGKKKKKKKKWGRDADNVLCNRKGAPFFISCCPFSVRPTWAALL